MIEGRDQLSRRILAVLACAALLSLLHTVNHDSLAGADHHDDGDTAALLLAIVLDVAGGLLGAGAVVGWILASHRRAPMRAPTPVAISAVHLGPALPSARAGPGIPIILSALRR